MKKKTFFLTKWLKDVPIATKLYVTVGIMALLIATELLTLWFAVNTLSAVRAYVQGEGLWSKAQKDAVYHLQRYARTHDEVAWHDYNNFIKVPLGDRKARLEMLKENPDLDIVRNGFLEGRIPAEDVDRVIELFRRFHNIHYISKAIRIWTEADSVFSGLLPIGEQIHADISSGIATKAGIDAKLEQVISINKKLTKLEDDFSYTLSEGSRWLERIILTLLLCVAILVEISGLLLTILVSRGISRGINEVVIASKSIAAGNLSARAKVLSRDEIGLLAESFNHMADDLEKKKIEQARAEENLRMQKELYETLVTAQSEMGEGVVVTEGDKIVYTNEALCRLYGYSKGEILAMPTYFSLFAEPELRGDFQPFHMNPEDAPASVREMAVKRKDNSLVDIEYAIKQVKTRNKTRMVSIFRDITEQKKAAADLVAKSGELFRSNKELEQFAYAVSHDLREPLRSVSSYLQLIERRYHDKLDPEGRAFITHAVQGAGRMEALIKGLLSYSRIGVQTMQLENVDCRALIDSTLANLYRIVKENDAGVTVEGDIPSIVAEPLQMELLFQNLLSNAIKFRGKEKPEIQIRAWDEGNYWKFSVADNGIGVPEEYSDRIFNLFQRLHTRDEYPGTGIGLAICKKIAESHGGKIWCESVPGQGSTFYFTIKKLQGGS